eukprot:265991-Pelagomonas_calceolata.AAC.2
MVIDARGLQSKRQTFLECSELPPWRMQGHPQLSTECRTLLLMRTGCFAEVPQLLRNHATQNTGCAVRALSLLLAGIGLAEWMQHAMQSQGFAPQGRPIFSKPLPLLKLDVFSERCLLMSQKADHLTTSTNAVLEVVTGPNRGKTRSQWAGSCKGRNWKVYFSQEAERDYKGLAYSPRIWLIGC